MDYVIVSDDEEPREGEYGINYDVIIDDKKKKVRFGSDDHITESSAPNICSNNTSNNNNENKKDIIPFLRNDVEGIRSENFQGKYTKITT